MTIWAVLNVVASLIVAVIVAFKLCRWPDKFTPMERVGMALVGAGSLMTVGPIISFAPTPFEDWSATLLRGGCAIYFIGRMLRHRHLNAAAVRQARSHLRISP
jgi:hypothetical protein